MTVLAERESTPLAIDEWDMIKEQASMLVRTGFLPVAFKTAEQVVAVVLSGRELGIPPMQALRGIHIIQGTPALKPELMLGLCIQRVPGFTFRWSVCDEKRATFVATRPGLAEPYTSVFTMEDAQRAGLAGKDNWKHYPGNMLRWRACANALHAVCPDVLVGIYTPDEMGAVTDEAGEVIQLEATPVPEEAEVKLAAKGRAKAPPSSGDTPTCADCGKIIEPRKLTKGPHAGTVIDVAAQIQLSQKAYGRSLCLECAALAKEAKEKQQVDTQALDQDTEDRAVAGLPDACEGDS